MLLGMSLSPFNQTPKNGITPIGALHLFPYYQTRADYEAATGQACPPFNPMLPPKKWVDPKADPKSRRNVVYANALAFDEKGQFVMETRGGVDFPVLEPLVMTGMQAASVNIPESAAGSTGELAANDPNAVEMAPPLRALEEWEEVFFIWGGVAAVRDKRTIRPVPSEGDGFTANDRKTLNELVTMLQAFGAKVGALNK